jgi:hypothetical protein
LRLIAGSVVLAERVGSLASLPLGSCSHRLAAVARIELRFARTATGTKPATLKAGYQNEGEGIPRQEQEQERKSKTDASAVEFR